MSLQFSNIFRTKLRPLSMLDILRSSNKRLDSEKDPLIISKIFDFNFRVFEVNLKKIECNFISITIRNDLYFRINKPKLKDILP